MHVEEQNRWEKPDHWHIGVIGGSGLYEGATLDDAQQIPVASAFGEPSGPVTTGSLEGVRMTFIARHGEGHRLGPGQVNYRANIDVLKRFMLVFGSISSAFDFVTFALLLVVFRSSVEVFRTGWFVESLLTEVAIALVLRTRRPMHESRAGRWLVISSVPRHTIRLPGRSTVVTFTATTDASAGWSFRTR